MSGRHRHTGEGVQRHDHAVSAVEQHPFDTNTGASFLEELLEARDGDVDDLALPDPRGPGASRPVIRGPSRRGASRRWSLGGETDAHLDRKLAHQPLGDDLSLVLVQVASGKGLALCVVEFDTIVVFVGVSSTMRAPNCYHVCQWRQWGDLGRSQSALTTASPAFRR